jgi:hypothetical protein
MRTCRQTFDHSSHPEIRSYLRHILFHPRSSEPKFALRKVGCTNPLMQFNGLALVFDI